MSTPAGEVLQYGRQCSCIIGDLNGNAQEYSQLKLQFNVRRGDTQTPNTLMLRIFNLSSQSISKIKSNYTQVQLQAGYKGNMGLIFQGQIKQYRDGRQDAKDSYLDLSVADGDEAYNYAVISQSISAGAPPGSIASIITDTFKGYGLQSGYVPALPTNGTPRGTVLFGLSRDEMRKQAMQNQCSWSIQDGKVVMIPLTSYIPGNVPLISPSTGLIGIPEQTQEGIHMRVLLNPNVRVGQAVKLDSTVTINQFAYSLNINDGGTNVNLKSNIDTNADGLYYVMRADHVGDTRGRDWYTDMICLSINAQATNPTQLQGLQQTAEPPITLFPN